MPAPAARVDIKEMAAAAGAGEGNKDAGTGKLLLVAVIDSIIS
jgi:hypothetical protein